MNLLFSRTTVLFCLLFFYNAQLQGSTPDIVVAKDGSGNFTTIQAALSSIKAPNIQLKVILVKSGTYNEKIFITTDNILLKGVHKDSVKIVYAELRKNWRKEHDSDYGSAVVNIAPEVSNLILSNVTIHNNYGGLYGDHDHQFAIRGGGTKIIMMQCSIIADGGDALSLWNTKNGMYYHSGCYFEGYVDYVCPRGWCFIDSSRFYGHNLSASIWMDGDMDSTQKFVLKNCYFDGVPGFPLGRHHREAAFYLLNCKFSKNMADRAIYFCGPSPIKYPGRYYYYNCTKEDGNFTWFADNLHKASSNLEPDTLTPLSVFNGRWDPLTEIKQMQIKGQL
ncbi:MAG: pectin esterase [Ignavibacteriales bacterium]|nr:pectin esterase [Ignavibacteriales bacterium]